MVGLHTARGDFDGATDIGYRFRNGKWCSVRISDDDPPELVAKRLREIAMMIESAP